MGSSHGVLYIVLRHVNIDLGLDFGTDYFGKCTDYFGKCIVNQMSTKE